VDYSIRLGNPDFKAIRFKTTKAFAPGSTFKANDAAFVSTAGTTSWAPFPRDWVDPSPTNWVLSNVKNSDQNDRRMAVEAIQADRNAVFIGKKTWIQPPEPE
jgi:hypothetical protein